MISRPIVAGPLAGLLVGEPLTGMWVGSLLEILSLRQLPIGASRGWDTGPAAIAATATAVSWGEGPVALLVGVGIGVLIGWVGSWSVHVLRQVNAKLVAGEGRPLETAAALTVWHFSAMGLDLLRASVLTAISVWCFTVLARTLGGSGVGLTALLAALVVLAAASISLGVDMRMMARGRRVWMAFGVGMALAAIVELWLL